MDLNPSEGKHIKMSQCYRRNEKKTELAIHNQKGSIWEKNSYGNDSFPPIKDGA